MTLSPDARVRAARVRAAIRWVERTREDVGTEPFDDHRDLWTVALVDALAAARRDAATLRTVEDFLRIRAALAARPLAAPLPAEDAGAIERAARAFVAVVDHTVIMDGTVEAAWNALLAALGAARERSEPMPDAGGTP